MSRYCHKCLEHLFFIKKIEQKTIANNILYCGRNPFSKKRLCIILYNFFKIIFYSTNMKSFIFLDYLFHSVCDENVE